MADYSIYKPMGSSSETSDAGGLSSPTAFDSQSSSKYSVYQPAGSVPAPDNPVNGQTQTSAPKFDYQDSSKPWYERAWSWANTPLTSSLFGMPEEREGAGGFERGAEHIIAGLTSPLSVALGLATFGTGSLLTSAGETALKEATLAGGKAAFTAADIAQIAKGSQAALKAFHGIPDIEPLIQGTLGVGGHDLGLLQKARQFFGPVSHDMELAEPEFQKILSHAGLNPQQIEALGKGAISAEEREALAAANGGFTDAQLKELARTGNTIKNVTENAGPVRQAVEAAGVDWDTYKRGRDFLRDSKLDEAALLGGDLIDRGAFQILHHVAPDLSLGTTLKAARTAKTLMNTGFTLQQLEGAAAMSPRFFDALKEGDYDKAAEYGTEWAANAILGVAGASHALHSWGELAEPILGSKFKPSDEQLRVNKMAGVREVEGAVGDTEGLRVYRETLKFLGHDPDKVSGYSKAQKAELEADLTRLHLAIEMGKDPELANTYRTYLRRTLGPGEENGRPSGEGTSEVLESLGRTEGGTLNRGAGGGNVPDVEEGGGRRNSETSTGETTSPLTGHDAEGLASRRGSSSPALSTSVGEVRVGTDGRSVVWLSPSAWDTFNKAVTSEKFSGLSISSDEVATILRKIPKTDASYPQIKQLLNQANKQSTSPGIAALRTPTQGLARAVFVLREELNHTWQRELSQNGDIYTQLRPEVFSRLHGIIPEGMKNFLDKDGYPDEPVVRVAEASAKLMGGKISQYGLTSSEVTDFLSEYFDEVIKQHGPDALNRLTHILGSAKELKEKINAENAAKIGTDEGLAGTGAGKETVRGVQDRGQAGPVEGPTGKSEGLKAREVETEPVSFVSPNVYKIGNVSEAEKRLNSRSQKLAEKLSEDIGAHLGIKVSVRPSIGHWEGGAANSMVSRFAPGTSPDAVEYHNAIMAKVERQNTGISFHPDPKGPDVAFQFRVPSSVADPKTIARLLEEHPISGSSIEPVPGGHNVMITSPGGELRGPVSEIASRLKATEVKEHNGRQVTLGDWNDRNAASTVYDARIRELEAAHPEWRKIRTEFESSPAYNTLSKLIREAEDKVKSDKTASPFLAGVHGSRTANITELDTGFQGKGPQKGAEVANAKRFPEGVNPPKISFLNLEGAKGEPFYERLPYQYRAVLNSENLYNWTQDRDNLLPKAEAEARAKKWDTIPGATGAVYQRLMQEAGYDGYYHPGHNQIGVFKNTPVEKALREGTHQFSPKPETVGTAAGAKADTDFFAKAKAELGTDNISAVARRAQELKDAARPVNGLFSKERTPEENLAPTWYLKSNQLVDSRMQGPMPADTVLKMMENNGVKPDELKYTGLSDFLREKGKEPVRPEELREYLAANNLQIKEVTKGGPLFAREGRPVNGLPENIEEMLRDNEFAKKSPEYQKKVLDALDMIAENRLPENINKAYKYATSEDGRNWELAHRNGMMDEFIDNHVHRKYLKNEQGNIVVSDAKAGKFATNTTGARRRAYDTLMTALLKSPDEIKFDPAEAISKDRAEVIKAAANRKFVSQLMSEGLVASDGRPVAYLNGAGNVVSGENGKDPKIFVDPERVRKINVDDKTIEHLTHSGDLQRFLDDGTLKDITPYVHPDNIGAAIDRLSKEALKSIDYTKYDEQGNNVLLSQIERLKEMQKTGDYSGLKELNDMQSKRYAWSPQGYVELDRSAMRGWNFVTNTPDGSSVLVNSNIMAHPEYAQYLKNRLGLEKGALSQSSVGRAVLSAGKAAKETLLSLSPFHLVQIGLRGIMTGVNPFTLHAPDIETGAKVNPADPHSPTKQYKMVENGLTTGRDFKSMQEYTEGLASGNHSLLRRVPVVGPILADTMQWQTDFLFKRYLPAIKAAAAEKLFDDYQAKYPEWSTDKIARAAASHANDSFGGVNWRAMGRNATTQEFARAVLLAPDWLESELRSGARLFNKDEGAIGRRQVVIMAGSVYLMARALNALTTGNPHYEAPFDLATKSKDGKETLWGIRMLPSDLLHLASSPAQFVKGRLSPGVGLTQELLSGRDKMGHKMQPQDLWVDAVRNLMPIPVQSIGQAITNTGPQVGNVGQGWKALGGTARTYATPAQQKAVELASTHTQDGFVDPVQQARHRAVQELGDRLRSGDITWPDLVKMTYGTSQLTEAELKKIQNNYKVTQSMPSDMAHLYSRASHLPAKEFLDVWDTANITEQKALHPLLLQAQKKYIRKAAKEMTPDQRQQDPTFQRLLKMAMGTPVAAQTQ